MKSMLAKWKSRDFLMVILFLQSLVYATIFFNVPIARQVIGFLYFTFVPGIVVIKLLKLDKLDGLETLLFSVGLSIAFLMLAGLLINEFCFLLGISKPLSLMPLMIILNSSILLGGILACLRSDDVKLWEAKTLGLHPLVLLLMGLPILSVVGAMLANVFGSNLILLFVIILISLLFVIGVVSEKLLPPKLFPVALFVIALAVLYHSSLISNYIVTFASDVPVEYFVFKNTQNNAYWSSTNPYFGDIIYGRYHSMLSITILPTIYSSLLNIDSIWMFKILYPLILAFVPLGLYQVWQIYVGKRYAFTSTFFYMAQTAFYTEMLGLNRQIVAELFFVLLLLVILNKKLKPVKKTMCFMVLALALVTSHYALAEIFLFFISFAFISLVVLKRPSRSVTASMLVFFFVVMFSWYIYASGSASFDSFLLFGNHVYSQLGEFFNPAARGQVVLRGLGLESPPTIWNAVGRAVAYSTQFLVVVGFVGLVTRRVKAHFERNYFVFTLIAMAFLAALLLVPGLANTINMTRFYNILLFFLAPLCVIGVKVLVHVVFKRKEEFLVSLLLLIVLVPYFLFQTNFVYEVTNSESWSVPLSKYRMEGLRLYGLGYIAEESVFGARWISKNVNIKSTQIYADLYSRNRVLTIYGMIDRGAVDVLSNTTKIVANGTLFLGLLNVAEDKIIGVDVWNSTELSFRLDSLNRIYSNGACEIYRNVPTKPP